MDRVEYYYIYSYYESIFDTDLVDNCAKAVEDVARWCLHMHSSASN